MVCTDPSSSPNSQGVAQRRPRRQSAATIALAPVPGDARSRDLILDDLGQATMSIMVAAADLGIGSAHSAVADQDLARRLLGFPEDRFCAWLISLRSSRRPPARRSSGPTGARSATSCTAAAGSHQAT